MHAIGWHLQHLHKALSARRLAVSDSVSYTQLHQNIKNKNNTCSMASARTLSSRLFAPICQYTSNAVR